MARVRQLAKVIALVALCAACGGETETTASASGIQIEPSFVRTPNPGAPATAGYLTLTANADDALIAATAPLVGSVEIHTMDHGDDGRMVMRRVDAIELPKGETVSLAPGGYHLMMMAPEPELASTDEIDVTLTFREAGDVTVTLPVRRNAP